MNCGKNWNNVGSPQSILVERPAVRLYWVSIFQVRDEKILKKIHELVVLINTRDYTVDKDYFCK